MERSSIGAYRNLSAEIQKFLIPTPIGPMTQEMIDDIIIPIERMEPEGAGQPEDMGDRNGPMIAAGDAPRHPLGGQPR